MPSKTQRVGVYEKYHLHINYGQSNAIWCSHVLQTKSREHKGDIFALQDTREVPWKLLYPQDRTGERGLCAPSSAWIFYMFSTNIHFTHRKRIPPPHRRDQLWLCQSPKFKCTYLGPLIASPSRTCDLYCWVFAFDNSHVFLFSYWQRKYKRLMTSTLISPKFKKIATRSNYWEY